MELQAINKYPILNPPTQNSPHRLAPIRQQHLHPQNPIYQPQYVNFAPNYKANLPLQAERLSRYPVLLPPGQNPTQNYYPQGIPSHFQHPVQLPMNYSPDGYYFYNPAVNQHLAHPTPYNSNEHFNDMTQNLHFTQQPDTQDLTAKYAELEKEAQKYKCVSFIHRAVVILAGLGIFGLGLLLIFSQVIPDSCELLSNDKHYRFCSRIFGSFQQPQMIALSFATLFLGGLTILFHEYALRIYLQRKARAMNSLHYVYAFLLIINTVTLHLISIGIFGYLTYASGKLRKTFREMEEIKSQLTTQGIDTKNLSLSLAL